MLILFLGIASIANAANGYGTSSISVSQNNASIQIGSSSSLSYSVNLATGNTWGTTLSVVNNDQLASQGIMVSLSNPSGDPTYSGTMSITVGSSATAGTYPITLQATGDDPSASNATVMLTVTSQSAASNSSTAATTAASTSINYYGSGGASYSSSSTLLYMLIIGIIIVIIGMVIAMAMKKSPISRLIILGVALILIGVIVWLYGDYSGGNYAFIWSGVALIIIGIIVWLIGDRKGHLI